MKHYILVLLGLLFIKAEAQSSALIVPDSLFVSGDYTKAINAYAEVGTSLRPVFKSLGRTMP